jgi:DNA-binding NarL/FixJ family response regulator
VLVVDDHADFRRSARALLQAEGFDVVGEARDGDEALAETLRLGPQVVMLDVQLPGEDGITVAARLAGIGSPPVVVLVSGRDARTYGPRLAGARFLAKRDLTGAALKAVIACDG